MRSIGQKKPRLLAVVHQPLFSDWVLLNAVRDTLPVASSQAFSNFRNLVDSAAPANSDSRMNFICFVIVNGIHFDRQTDSLIDIIRDYLNKKRWVFAACKLRKLSISNV